MSPEQLAEIAAQTKAQIDGARSWVLVTISADGDPSIATCVPEDGHPIDQMAIGGMLDGLAYSCRKNTADAFAGMIKAENGPSPAE